MDPSSWLKQTKGKPLFQNLLWSKPESKLRAGKLLIIGGNSSGFSKTARAYEQASKAGVGSIRVLLPDSLRPSLGNIIPDTIYCPGNRSGGFARESLAVFTECAAWADLTILSGDFGKNSETAVLIESLIYRYHGPLSLTNDTLEYFLINPSQLFNRRKSLIVTPLTELQKLLSKSIPEILIKSSMNLFSIVAKLNELTLKHPIGIITIHEQQLICFCGGKSSSTKTEHENTNWQTDLCAYGSTWWLQNPEQMFEALTTSIADYLGPTPI